MTRCKAMRGEGMGMNLDLDLNRELLPAGLASCPNYRDCSVIN